jgi:hypothetical protein
MEAHPLLRIRSIRPIRSASYDRSIHVFIEQHSSPVFASSDIQLMLSALSSQSIDSVIE